jgi:hypothetical protein
MYYTSGIPYLASRPLFAKVIEETFAFERAPVESSEQGWDRTLELNQLWQEAKAEYDLSEDVLVRLRVGILTMYDLKDDGESKLHGIETAGHHS